MEEGIARLAGFIQRCWSDLRGYDREMTSCHKQISERCSRRSMGSIGVAQLDAEEDGMAHHQIRLACRSVKGARGDQDGIGVAQLGAERVLWLIIR
jgi:hypothetical protein